MRYLLFVKSVIPLLFLLFIISSGTATTFPERPSGPVADFAGIIDADTRLKVSSAARNLWIENKIGLVVVTIDHPGGMAHEEYADILFSKWGLRQINTSAAVLVLICRNPADIIIMYKASGNDAVHRMFDELSGCADIRSGAFGTGLLVLTAELVRTLNIRNFSNGISTEYPGERLIRVLLIFSALAFGGILTAIILMRMRLFSGTSRSFGEAGYTQFRCIYSSGLFLSRGEKEQVRGGIIG